MSCGETYGVFELVRITTRSPQVLPPVWVTRRGGGEPEVRWGGLCKIEGKMRIRDSFMHSVVSRFVRG